MNRASQNQTVDPTAAEPAAKVPTASDSTLKNLSLKAPTLKDLPLKDLPLKDLPLKDLPLKDPLKDLPVKEEAFQDPTLTLKDIPEDDRPRERLLRCGGKVLSDGELIALLLRSGRRGQSVREMAEEVLADHGGLHGLLDAEYAGLARHGLGRAKAATLLAAVELSRRLARSRIPERRLLKRPDTVATYLALRYGRQDQEVMGAVYLDVRRRLLADVDLYRGTLSRAAVEPRLILKEALLRNASAFVLFHTHPSGDPAPSAEDLLFTRQLADAARLLGVEMVDHLILGSAGRWVSLQRRGSW